MNELRKQKFKQYLEEANKNKNLRPKMTRRNIKGSNLEM